MNCNGCYYRKPLSNKMDTACHYSIIEGRLRPCEARSCTVKLVLTEDETKRRDREYRYKNNSIYTPAFRVKNITEWKGETE